MNRSRALSHLSRLSGALQEQPVQKWKVRNVLRRARKDGFSPAQMYRGALELHPRNLPLPPDPREILPGEQEPGSSAPQ